MTRFRSRARVSRGTGSRRKWVWARHDVVGASIPTATTSFSDLLSEFESVLSSDLLGVSIMRLRGEVKVDQSAVLAARVWNEPADGVTQLDGVNHGPTLGGKYHDWFWYQSALLDVTTGVRVVNVDVRSSRKLEELGQSILFAIANSSGSTLTASWNLSLGLKLP